MSPEEPNQLESAAELPLGKYKITVDFKLFSGQPYHLPLERQVALEAGDSLDVLKHRAISWAESTGLHNFGMDVYYGHYPKGHPVEFTLQHESGKEIKFTQVFDASGYPVREKL